MTAKNTEAIITCPHCGSKFKKKIPSKGKHINCKCVFCHTVFGINSTDDCCVYCTYSDVKCPNSQKK